MFKNYDKVFKFTFKNQTSTSGYRVGTVVTALILFLVPVIVFSIIGFYKSNNSAIKPCNADTVMVVNPLNPSADFSMLNYSGIEHYTDLNYVTTDSVENAVKAIDAKGAKHTLIMVFVPTETSTRINVLIPDGSDLTKKNAKNFDKFLRKNEGLLAILASGADVADMATLYSLTSTDIFDTDGYKADRSLFEETEAKADQTNSEIKPVFNMILVYITTMIMYFIVIFYGSSIIQNVILEKGNKLMDTMLISLKPQAMILGKLLGVLSAALLQFFSWIIALALGMIAAVRAYKIISPSEPLGVITFFDSFKELGLFTPGAIIIAVLVLLFGVIFYASLATICGAISGSKEEAAANQGLFMMVLMVSFYIVLFGGINSTGSAAWMYILPSTGAMLLPAGICSGTTGMGVAIISLAVMVVSTVALIWLAGKLYTMMSLYKGNKVNLVKALKMLAGK